MEKPEQGQTSTPAVVKTVSVGTEPPVLVKRKRKVARQVREKTPEASKTGRLPSDEESSNNLDQSVTVQTVQLQLRPAVVKSGPISAHKSKILNRKNKSFGGAVARSSSTPRQENSAAAPETYDFLRIARRSLSSPRHKEESSESGRSSPHHMPKMIQKQTVSSKLVEPESRDSRQIISAELSSDSQATTASTKDSRLASNLKKFEDERRKFELEKKRFEREKRELSKMRYKLFDPSDRRFIPELYRKMSDRTRTPSDSDDKQVLLNKFLESQQQSALEAKQNARRGSLGDETEETDQDPPPAIEVQDYESSTATMSESEISTIDADETDADDEGNNKPEKTREKRSTFSHSSTPSSLRKRLSKRHSLTEPVVSNVNVEDEKKTASPKKGFFSRIFSIFTIRKKPKPPKAVEKPKVVKVDRPISAAELSTKFGLIKLWFRLVFVDSRREWQRLKHDYPAEVERMRLKRNKCISHLLFLFIFCGFGGIFFRYLEGNYENTYKCGVGRVRRDFIDHLWLASHNLREEDWKSQARTKLRKFEDELHTAHESGVTSYSGMKTWNFLNSLIYCWTVVTSIGYGHIYPTTVVGRAVTIVYAIIGIPMFLILLADFGKLFTRGIKFIWVFVRRVYYTGTFRQIRKHHNVQQMVHGMNIVYEIAMRRPTLANLGMIDPEKGDCDTEKVPGTPPSQLDPHDSLAETPTSPAPETYLIDDEFNLPISVAIVILLLYIFIGAAVYCLWEDWSYFESIYFVFISMSTIGFGDFVPQHPIFMMCSIAYLIFGLALTSMCINVVQVKLSDSFKQASVKIGATIGFEMSDEEAMSTQNQTPIEGPSIPPSPKFERPPTISPSPDPLPRNYGTDSPPPLPRRSPVTPDMKIRSNGKEKDKSKHKKSKK